MNIVVYRFAGSIYFDIPATGEEGKIMTSIGRRGNEDFIYISHLEECENMEEKREDEIIKHLESNFELITFAKEL